MGWLWECWRRWRQPEEAALDDAIARGDAIRAPQGAVRDLFAEVAQEELGDFERVRPGRWVAPLGEGDFRVLDVRALKGNFYTLEWGVSLSYVPDLAQAAPRFHRTPKSARLDLSESAQETDVPVYRVQWRWRPEAGWWLPGEIASMWQSCLPAARAFWERAATPEQVLALALEQDADPLIGHVPAPLLVAAFAAVRVGDTAQGADLLERALEQRPDTPADAARRGVAQVAARRAGD